MTRILFSFSGLDLYEQHCEAIRLALDLQSQGLDIQIGSQNLDCPLVDYLEWLGVDWIPVPRTPEINALPS